MKNVNCTKDLKKYGEIEHGVSLEDVLKNLGYVKENRLYYMKYRILKKKNTLNRVQYIADKIGVIQRGIWVEYFKKHPKDLPKVLRKIQSQDYKTFLKHDIRKNYHNSSFNQKLCDWTIWQIENGYFGKYAKLDILDRLNYSLACIPIFECNPYGVNEKWRDGSIHSTSLKYEL